MDQENSRVLLEGKIYPHLRARRSKNTDQQMRSIDEALFFAFSGKAAPRKGLHGRENGKRSLTVILGAEAPQGKPRWPFNGI